MVDSDKEYFLESIYDDVIRELFISYLDICVLCNIHVVFYTIYRIGYSNVGDCMYRVDNRVLRIFDNKGDMSFSSGDNLYGESFHEVTEEILNSILDKLIT